jgi:hypothetical protein
VQEASQIQIGSNRVTWAVEVTDAISMLSTITAALLAMATPQGAEDPRLEPRLQPKQLKKLNRLAQRWIRSELKWDENPRYREKRDGDRTLFVSALARRSTKHDVLASVGDLLQIFDKVFPYERRRPTGTFQHHKELNYA